MPPVPVLSYWYVSLTQFINTTVRLFSPVRNSNGSGTGLADDMHYFSFAQWQTM